jgi:hypothetical protein
VEQLRKVLPRLPFHEKTALWAHFFGPSARALVEDNARRIDRLLRAVARGDRSYTRTLARIVHDGTEGECDTLVVVGKPGGGDRRLIEFATDLLRLNGIQGDGTPFILHEFHRPGHMKLQCPLPAIQVLTKAETAMLGRAARRAERLPEVQ